MPFLDANKLQDMLYPLLTSMQEAAMEVEIEKERAMVLRIRLQKEQLHYEREQRDLKELLVYRMQELNQGKQT